MRSLRQEHPTCREKKAYKPANKVVLVILYYLTVVRKLDDLGENDIGNRLALQERANINVGTLETKAPKGVCCTVSVRTVQYGNASVAEINRCLCQFPNLETGR